MIDASQVKQWIADRRWFGGKGIPIESIETVDLVPLDDLPERLVYAIVEVHLAGDRNQLYGLPVLVDAEGATRDAIEDPPRLAILGELMAHGETLHGERGTFRFSGPGLDPLAPPQGESVRVMGAEQSNTSVVFDDAVILKIYRRLAIGPNPDVEMTRLLTTEGFENIPPQVGEIEYVGEIAGVEALIDLALGQTFLTDATEGWSLLLDELKTLPETIASPEASEGAILAATGDQLDSIEWLGDTIASLHVLLSREGLEPEFAPEPIDTADMKDWAEQARDALEGLIARGISELEDIRDGIERRLDAAQAIDDAGLKMRIHGDLHLGQVMRSPRGWMILDFEGEPTRPLDERRSKHSPLKDVAGMLRSFSYAAATALGEHPELAARWEELARDRFLHGYFRTSYEGHFLPPDRDDLAVLLDLFEIDKALYEIGYELSHRPDWVSIPIGGLVSIARRDPR